MQHFTSADPKYAYSPHHDPIGTVQPGETFTVDAVEGWSNFFRSPADFTPETYHAAEAVKWAVTGPIAVAGAEPGGVVAVTIHEVEVRTPGVCVVRPVRRRRPARVVDHETAVALYESSDGSVRFDEHTTLPSRPLVGCLAVAPAEGELHAMLQGRYGGNLDCKELVAGATLVLPYEHAGAGLYFGDCKALMSDGEIVGPPEVGALVTATAELRPRPASLRLAAARDGRPHHDDRRRHAARVGRPAGVPRAARLGGRRLRTVARKGCAADGDGGRHRHLPGFEHRLHGLLHDAARRAAANARAGAEA